MISYPIQSDFETLSALAAARFTELLLTNLAAIGRIDEFCRNAL